MNVANMLALALLVAGCGGSGGTQNVPSPSPDSGDPPPAVGREDLQPRGRAYTVYVGAESADLMHRVRLGPDGASVEKTTQVGELSVETEGPHGFGRSPDGEYVYMTTGHGFPDGKLWKFHAGPDTMVAEPVLLGRFPATLDLTSDGLYAFVANFNLHGEHVSSTVSVVYTPDMIEVVQIETCTMPHGARIDPAGTHLFSACMRDDQVVEIDTRTFDVSRRFSVAKGREASLETDTEDSQNGALGRDDGASPTCSPTWAQPSAEGARVFVACNGADVIHEIDRETWTLRRTFETGRGPYNLAVTPDGRLLVATLKQGAKVQFFDIETGASLAIAESSTTVTHGVVGSPDSRFAFVSVEGVGAEPGKVDIFDLTTFERVADVEVGQQAGGITFWKMEDVN